jgi:hypothetical protein
MALEPDDGFLVMANSYLQGDAIMNTIFAQGDLLIERVEDAKVASGGIEPEPSGALVLAEGETSGHRHALYGTVAMFRDDGLAAGIPDGLYVGHVTVLQGTAKLVHEEHAPINLQKGTWRIRRQRELEPKDARIVAD